MISVENDYLNLFRNNPLPMWIYDKATLNIIDVNGAVLEKYGYNREEFQNMNLMQICDTGDVIRFGPYMNDINSWVGNKTPWRHATKSGKSILTKTMAVDILFGGKDCRLLIAQEFHEEKENFDEIEKTEEMYKIITENVSEAIITIDGKSKILYMNNAACIIFGYDKIELLGRDISVILPEYLPHFHRAAIKHLPRPGEFIDSWKEVALPGLHKEGNELSVIVSFKETSIAGKHFSIGFIKDVSYEVKLSAQNYLSQKLYQRLFDISPQGIAVVGLNSRIELCNDKFAQLLGYNLKQEVINKEFWSFIWDSDKQKGFEYVDQIIRNSELKNLELNLRTVNDSKKIVELNARLIHDADGRPISIMIVCVDISSNKKILDRLRYQANLINNINDAIVSVDEYKRITVWNKASEDLFDIKAEEAVGQNIDLILKTKLSTRERNNAIRHFRLTGRLTMELLLTAKNGKQVFVENSVTQLKNKDGRSAGLVSVIRDITDKKNLENKQKEIEDRFRLIAENAYDLIHILDEDRRFVYFSPSHITVLKYTEKELKSLSSIHELIHPDDLDAVKSWSGTKLINFRMRDSSGNYLWFEGSRNIMEEGSKRLIIGIIRDITEKKLISEQLKLHESYLSGIINSAMDAIITTDHNGIINICNDAAETMFGCNKHDYKGKSIKELLSEEHLNELLNADSPAGIRKLTGIRSNGEQFPIEASVSHITDNDVNLIIIIARDISGRLNTENELRKTSDMFKYMAQSIKDVFFIADNNSDRLEYLSPSFEKLWGITAEFAYANPIAWRDLVHPDDREKISRHDKTVDKSKEREIDYRIVKSNGDIRWMRTRLFPVKNEDGEVIKRAGLTEDITERKFYELSLKESEERFRNLADTAPIFIYLKDHNGKIEFINRQFREFLGTEENLVEWRKFIHPDDIKAIKTIIKNAVTARKKFEFEYRINNRGVYKWIHEISIPRYDENNTFLGFTGGCYDITERKNNEFSSTLNNNRLQLLNDLTKSFINSVNQYSDLPGIITERISVRLGDASIISRFYHHEGVLAIESINYPSGSPFADKIDEWKQNYKVYSEGDIAKVVVKSKKTLMLNLKEKQHLPEEYEAGLRRISETFNPHSIIISPILQNKEVYGVIYLIRFNSELPSYSEDDKLIIEAVAERASLSLNNARLFNETNFYADEVENMMIEKTAELETAYRELDAVSHAVSHDLRSPIRAINGYIGLLREEERSNLTEEGKRLLGIVMQNSKQLSVLIDDLLYYAKLSRAVVNKSTINMHEIVTTASHTLLKEEKQRQIDLNVDILPDVYADREMMKIVWTNLISNSIKFTRKKDRAVIKISGYARGNKKYFIISDNGIGVKTDKIENFIGIFKRHHSTTEYEGSGIGLAIVQRIIHKHGGTIYAESNEDEGTIITLKFPNTIDN